MSTYNNHFAHEFYKSYLIFKTKGIAQSDTPDNDN